MYRDTASRLLFILLLLAIAWSSIRIIAPFIAGLTWAAVLVVTFRPFHRRLRAVFGGRDWPATTIVTLLVAAFVIVPVTGAAVKAFQGAVAGFPLQDLRVVVHDGKHHSVDSKEVAFVTAGRKAFLEAVAQAGPQLLEPIVELTVTAPEQNMGDLTGALGQQPFLQGFWPVMQLYLQIDRGISAANLDTRAQLVTKETVGNVGKRFEN